MRCYEQSDPASQVLRAARDMYSLYRAWLSLAPCAANLAPPPPTAPSATLPVQSTPLNLSGHVHFTGSPDVTLRVGPTMTEFSAHRTVLGAHSGFFKAALLNHPGPSPVSVPNVNVDEFSSLLTFMYTGYLDLNVNNIYNILLATHILHMPRALELCRGFLVRQSHAAAASSPGEAPRLVRPIASRKTAAPHQQIFPPIAYNLTKSAATPFRTVAGCEANDPETEEAAPPRPSTSKTEETKRATTRREGSRRASDRNEKAVVDVACCDGPVRFHRVLNRNYGSTDVENEYHIEKVNRNDAMNKAMNESIRRRDENGGATAAPPPPGEVFTCLYCNHTFKSQYCYQKHARRHLNPVGVDAAKADDRHRREVKLLDMNVQYYPCKTCGSKFPSYYFVHKHRKLCHADEMADNTNKNNEMVAEAAAATTPPDDNSKTSVIDVVDTEEAK